MPGAGRGDAYNHAGSVAHMAQTSRKTHTPAGGVEVLWAAHRAQFYRVWKMVRQINILVARPLANIAFNPVPGRLCQRHISTLQRHCWR